jgi:succinyl-CoA synthetase beta subunit
MHSQGGMNIEEVAEKDPKAIIKLPINIDTGLTLEAALSVTEKLNLGE